MEIFEGQSGLDFHDLVMEVDGSEHRARSEEPLRLCTDSIDSQLRLENARLVANVDETASFGELLASGLAEPFLEWAPGDHVRTRIHGVTIAAGEPVAVRGVPTYRNEPADGYRDSVERLEAVDVHVLAAGPDAASRLGVPSAEGATPKPMPEPAAERDAPVSLWLPLGLLATGAAAVTAGVVLSGPGGPAVLLTGLAMLSTALLLWRRKRFLPDLRAEVEDREGTGRRTGLGAYSTAALVAAHVMLIAACSLAFEGGAPLWGMALLVVALAVGSAVSLLRGGRRSFGRLRQLAGAATKLEPNQWGAVEGRVTKGTYARTRRHKKDSSTYTDSEGHTKTTSWWTFRDSVSAAPIRVDLDGGGTLEVVFGAGAVVGSTRVMARQDRLSETIEAGDAVRVVGRPTKVEGGWRMEARGKASLLVLGAASSAPAGAARKALAAHVLALCALFGLALTALVVAASDM